MKENNGRSILLVEDDELFCEAMLDFLSDAFDVLSAETAEKAIKLMTTNPPDLVLLDINLPDMHGIDLLKKIKVLRPELPIIMLTASESIPEVVESIKRGAYDYLTKPVDTDTFIMTLERALEASEIRQELEQRRNLQLATNKEYKLIGNSPALNRIRREITIVGKTNSTVLIQGETGTGKELVARALHDCSPRASNPFVAINCGAIPKELMESELFGHKKGAFTGAQKSSIGKFQLAHRGTLLLDEISEMSEDAQIKLLRVLEEREFYPVGSTELTKVDVRVIASTNRHLKEMAEKGTFRGDLFFRLNVCTLNLPPLRERHDDILDLGNHFLEENNIKFGKSFREISPGARDILLQYPWKGNVRELRNVIERIMLFENGSVVEAEHLDFLSATTPAKPSKQDSVNGAARLDGHLYSLPEDGVDLEKLEKQLMLQALERAKWNRTKAAKLLNLSSPTFYYRMEKYGIK